MSTKAIFAKDEDCKESWNSIKADFSIKIGDNDKLQISGKPVMERWETPYMHMLARQEFGEIFTCMYTDIIFYQRRCSL